MVHPSKLPAVMQESVLGTTSPVLKREFLGADQRTMHANYVERHFV